MSFSSGPSVRRTCATESSATTSSASPVTGKKMALNAAIGAKTSDSSLVATTVHARVPNWDLRNSSR